MLQVPTSPSFRSSVLCEPIGNTEEYDKPDGFVLPMEHEELQEDGTDEHHEAAE
jgi:hypothetical protein